MLTPTDFKNIKNFARLSPSHKAVFKHRLKAKCRRVFKDMEFLLLNYKTLGLDITDVMDAKLLASFATAADISHSEPWMAARPCTITRLYFLL